MSLTKAQIDSLIKRNCGINEDNTTSYPISDMTADENIALDNAFTIAFQSGGKWQVDDTNHNADYRIIKTTLVSGRRDYPFTTDEQGNIILDIVKVLVKNRDGTYYEVFPVDQETDANMSRFWDGNNSTGQPTRYDKLGNSIFLDVIPDYTIAEGIKVFINREGSHFTTSDTTKMPGIDGRCHPYIALYPSYQYAMRNGLDNKNDLKIDMLEMENTIALVYSNRSRDERAILGVKRRNYE